MLPTNDIRDQLRLDFEAAAEWRKRKADEFSDDSRNGQAAKICEALAASVDDVDDNLLTAYHKQFEDIDDCQAHQQMLQDIGFRSWPGSAAEFISDFVNERQR